MYTVCMRLKSRVMTAPWTRLPKGMAECRRVMRNVLLVDLDVDAYMRAVEGGTDDANAATVREAAVPE